MEQPQKRVALVTGAGTGMGRATAIDWAKNGVRVAVAGRREELLLEVVKEIEQNGGEAIAIKCDITVEEQVKNMVQKIVDTYGRLDYAFNNAAFQSQFLPVSAMDADYFRKVMDINVTGTMLCMKYELQVMEKQGYGAIVNNSSVNGLKAIPLLSAYTCSKHAVIGLTKTAALESASKGITVNVICPGIFPESEMVSVSQEATGNQFVNACLAQTPLKRPGKLQEIADLVQFLCSDKARFITGAVFSIDGGVVCG